jgi:hypothetical protein
MKSKKQIIKDYLQELPCYEHASLAEDCFSDGFDAGFAKAVELLRNNSPIATGVVLIDGSLSKPTKLSRERFADWLEEQKK